MAGAILNPDSQTSLFHPRLVVVLKVKTRGRSSRLAVRLLLHDGQESHLLHPGPLLRHAHAGSRYERGKDESRVCVTDFFLSGIGLGRSLVLKPY